VRHHHRPDHLSRVRDAARRHANRVGHLLPEPDYERHHLAHREHAHCAEVHLLRAAADVRLRGHAGNSPPGMGVGLHARLQVTQSLHGLKLSL